MKKYRFCSFSKKAKLPDGLWPIYYYDIQTKGDAPLHSCRVAACSDEWKEVVRDTPDIEEKDRRTLEKVVISDFIEYANGKKITDHAKEKYNTSYLLPKAEEILAANTVFIIDDSLDKDLINSIAKELYDAFKEAPHRSDTPSFYDKICLIRQTKNSPLEEIVHKLHSHLVVAADSLFQDSRKDREGPILLEGDTGTGKTYAAKLYAQNTNKKIIQINLSSITDTTLEARIRGYIKGVYTGANNDSPGWFEQANGNVLFLDEFQSVSIPYQIQFLDLLNPVSNRVEVAKMGEDGKRQGYDVKVILAINENAEDLIKSGRLRKDLYYRIRQTVKFPSLKERFNAQDGENLMRALLKTYRWRTSPCLDEIGKDNHAPDEQLKTLFPTFSAEAINELQNNHDWTGNLREFERVASDLYWNLDQYGKGFGNDDHDADIKVDNVRKYIHSLQSNKYTSKITSDKDEPLVKLVENTLAKHGYEIYSMFKNLREQKDNTLKDHKLSSPNSLRIFLAKNKTLLSESVLNQARIKKFMKWD